MKRELVFGHGMQGMRVDLSVCDMFAASETANELKNVLDNHKEIEEYRATPYDKRKEAYPEGEPKRIEVSQTTLRCLYQLMLKLSFEAKSTLFDEEDEVDDPEEQPF